MRRGQGFFTTLLMIVPMTAVPVMAVFGIPQFVPAARPIVPQANTAHRTPFIESRVGQSDRHSAHDLSLSAEPTLDLFQPAGAEAATVATASTTSSLQASQWSRTRPTADAITTTPRVSEPLLHHMTATPASVVPVDVVRTALGVPQSETERYQRSTPGESELAVEARTLQRPTWRDAVEQLNELGIRTFRLTPGSQQGTFQFSCLVSSIDDPRVSRWFDAEATEPLDAVARALAKVEDWNQKQ